MKRSRGGGRILKPIGLFFWWLSGLGYPFLQDEDSGRLFDHPVVVFLILFFTLLVMKMSLTLWLCEVALSEGCLAILQGSWHMALLLPGIGDGDGDVPWREPGLSVPCSEALPGLGAGP